MKDIICVTAFLTIFIVVFPFCSNEPPKSELEKKTEKLGDAVQDFGKEVAKSAEQTGNDAAETRDDVKKDIQESIANINKKIEETDRKMAKATKEQKVAWENDKKNLVAFRNRLNANLKDVGKDMKEGWNDFAAEVKKTIKDVGDRINQ